MAAQTETDDDQVVIIGAGPAGLTAALQLCKQGRRSIILEKDDVVGGISRTVHHKGYHFDIGGHRFFTKVKAVDDLWREILDDEDFLRRSRMSRIYYRSHFFDYPLRAFNALFGLGPWNSFLVLVSYARSRISPIPDERSFEDWVTNRFGRRLYETFFKTYTEKVWGIPCSELSADWAAQRIRGLSLVTAIKNALLAGKKTSGGEVIKTLIDAFDYPRLGPGMMWERAAEKVQQNGCELRFGAGVERVFWDGDRVTAVEVGSNGTEQRIEGSHFMSTMPVRELIAKAEPTPPAAVVEAANKLAYRDFLTVALIVDKPDLFPDNWIYIHAPEVKVGRVQNFKNWSPDMVPDPSKSCVGLEYFCFEGDGLWTTSDAELIELGKREMELLGLIRAADVIDGAVVRMPKAYPVYDGDYEAALVTVREFVDGLENLYLVGRNGMHRYNNQDHSMLTAMLAVENIGGAEHDIWSVNAEDEYHEEVREGAESESAADQLADEIRDLQSTQPHVPMPMPAGSSPATARILRRTFARLAPVPFGTAIGAVGGLLLSSATAWLVVKGPSGADAIGPRLALLGQFLIGFEVSWSGAVLGLLYGFALGFVAGFCFAMCRNLMLELELVWIRRQAEAQSLEEM